MDKFFLIKVLGGKSAQVTSCASKSRLIQFGSTLADRLVNMEKS